MKSPLFPHSGQWIVCGVWRDIDHEKRTKCKVHRRHLNEWANTPSRSASWTPPLVSASGSRSLVFINTVDVRSPFGSAGSTGRPSSAMTDSSDWFLHRIRHRLRHHLRYRHQEGLDFADLLRFTDLHQKTPPTAFGAVNGLGDTGCG